MHGRSRMTIDPRIPTMPGQSTPDFHRPGSHCLHQARSPLSIRQIAWRVGCILLRTACETGFLHVNDSVRWGGYITLFFGPCLSSHVRRGVSYSLISVHTYVVRFRANVEPSFATASTPNLLSVTTTEYIPWYSTTLSLVSE